MARKSFMFSLKAQDLAMFLIYLEPRKLTYKLKITRLGRKIIFQTQGSMLNWDVFHVYFDFFYTKISLILSHIWM